MKRLILAITALAGCTETSTRSGATFDVVEADRVIGTYERDGVRYADVRFGGVARQVCLHAVADVQVGEFVLVHVGFAIAKIDRAGAERALQLLAELDSVELREVDE